MKCSSIKKNKELFFKSYSKWIVLLICFHEILWRQNSAKESLLNHNIWFLKKLGTFHVRFIFRIIKISWNPFKDTFRNKRFTKPTESNKMTSLHTVKACNNRLFRSFNRLILWHCWKRFWIPILFVQWIKS